MHVGVAGLGKMGAAIAERLIETGNTVTVWNRSADKCRPLAAAGAHVAANPAALAGAAEAVITILTDSAALDAVYGGPAGLLAGAVKGKLFIEMSTLPPAVDIALAGKVRAVGATLVECPVAGTTGPARQGKLIGLMGAEPADAARAKPLLDQLCRRLEHCGPVGTGAIMKLAVNLPLIVYWQALGEALALCGPLGIDPARLVDLMSDTAGAAAVLKLRGPAVAKMLKGEDAGPVTFALADCTKDLRALGAEAAARGLALPVAAQTLTCFEEAGRHGLGSADAARQPVYWSGRTAKA
jgi:3-hydroxyisobutyrate dehydrogenase